MSINDPLLVPPPPPPIRRYRLDVGDGTWWELSWRPSHETFEAVHLTRDELRVERTLAWHGVGAGDIASLDELIERVEHPIPAAVVDALVDDVARRHPGLGAQRTTAAASSREVTHRQWVAERPERRVPHIDFGQRWTDSTMPGSDLRVSWIPDTGELYVTDRDESYVRLLAVVPSRHDLDTALAGWAVVGASPDPPLVWIELRAVEWVKNHALGGDHFPSPAGVVATSRSAPAMSDHGEVDPSHLADWENQLRGWEARLTAWAQSLYAQAGTEPRWSLPAEPATETLRALLAEPAFATTDIEEFARGFDLDPKLAERLITGRIADLDMDQIAQLCQGLHCSPYDLWGSELARSILHAYGPERWPRHIEPLDEGRQLGDSNEFTMRRLDVHAAELAGPLATVAAAWPTDDISGANDPSTETTVHATCYRRAGVLALGGDGQMTVVVNTAAPPEDTVEYHFSFRQMSEARPLTVEVDPTEFATGPLPSCDVIPQLAEAADQLRGREWMADVELIRFHDPGTGADQWLGWDTEVGSWQTWDDPRRYYPGDPGDVLDAGVFRTDELDGVESGADYHAAISHDGSIGSPADDTDQEWLEPDHPGVRGGPFVYEP
ncbi:MAG: hypothetical protein ACRD0U_10340, partial [Acidimicrobiales bacterium]